MMDGSGNFVGGVATGIIIMLIAYVMFGPPNPVYDLDTCAAVVEERRSVEMRYDLREIKAHLVSVDAQLANLRERQDE